MKTVNIFPHFLNVAFVVNVKISVFWTLLLYDDILFPFLFVSLLLNFTATSKIRGSLSSWTLNICLWILQRTNINPVEVSTGKRLRLSILLTDASMLSMLTDTFKAHRQVCAVRRCKVLGFWLQFWKVPGSNLSKNTKHSATKKLPVGSFFGALYHKL